MASTRIPVELSRRPSEWSTEKILEQYPFLSREDILACLHYASEILLSERVYPVKTTPTS